MAKKKAVKKIKPPPETLPFPNHDDHDDIDSDPDAILNNALKLNTDGRTLKRITCITELLCDKESLIDIADTVATGGSVSTVEMKLGLPDGMLKGWLRNGRSDTEGPFHVFYKFYLAASAEAKHNAESSLLLRNPAAWLDRFDPLVQLADGVDDVIQPSKDSNPDNLQPLEGTVTYKEFPE